MSRLDSMLRRLAAQRDGLNWAASLIEGKEGDALDMGLGNGRTYDHLREILNGRQGGGIIQFLGRGRRASRDQQCAYQDQEGQ